MRSPPRRARSFWWLCGALCLLAGPAVAQDAQTGSADDVRQVIEQHLERGKALLTLGAYAEAQAEFTAILQLDATHRDALRYFTQTQRTLEARQRKAARDYERLRSRAQELAIRVAREKAKEQARHAADAEQQVAQAREQRLKFLYNRGLALFQDGHYQAAIHTLQQMVLMDPAHPLVDAAQRLIAQAEVRHAGVRARTGGTSLLTEPTAAVSELEQQLAAKRVEIETFVKHAKRAIKDRRYDQAIEWLQRILVEDPTHRQAQELLYQAQTAKLQDEQDRLQRVVNQAERGMINDVVRAQLLPQPRQLALDQASAARAAEGALTQRLSQPISLAFDDVPLGDVLQFIGDAANVSIIPSPQLDLKARRVSLKVKELPLGLAVKYLAKSQALGYRIEQDVILIASPEEFANEPMQTRVFFLRSGIGPFALETSAIEPNPILVMEPLKELIEQAVPQPPDSKLVVDERTGAMIATNTAENLALIERLLSQLDVAPTQILIEARFIELTMTDLEHFAIESVLTGPLHVQKKGTIGAGQGSGQEIVKGGGFKFPALSREDEGLNLTLEGVLTGTQFETVLHLLDETKKSKTLSAPRVTTLNNQTATIRVVDEFRYPTKYEVSLIQFDINGDGDFDDAGETEFANVPQDFQKRDVGILLAVTPSLGKDGKTITLVLAPEVSSFSQFRDLGGGVTVPEFTSSQLTTSVVIDNGETVVLGGLMKDTISETISKVPFLGDLPVIGNLFRQTNESSARKNLLIFITARVLAPGGPTT